MNRKRIIIGSIAVGVALMCAGPFLPQVAAGYLPAVALQIGSTFLLIPIAVWVEGRLTGGLEEIRSSLDDESRAMRAAASIGLDALGKDVVDAFERVRKRAYETTLYVKLDNADVWLGFGMYSTYMLGVDYSPVQLYFTDPTLNSDQKADSVVQWDSKITGHELMERVADELRRHGRFPGRALFQPGVALERLREQVIRIILGQGADAESNV